MQQFLNVSFTGFTLGAIYAAFALCLVLIFRATRVINFAQGAQAAFTTYLAFELIDRGTSYWLALPAAIVAGFVLGALIERLIVRRVEKGPEINAVIVTLGLFVAIEALIGILFSQNQQGFPAPFGIKGFAIGDTTIALTGNDRYRIIAVALALVLLLAVFRFTNVGLRMRAAAFGQEVAQLLGIHVSRMLTLGWALAGAFGALAGILIAGGGFISPTYMQGVVIFAFVAAVLGGLDSFAGAVVGGLILGLTQSYVQSYVDVNLVNIAALLLLLGVLVIRPGGLFSASVARKV